MTAGRPDILIVMADQMVPSTLPFHGNPVTKTPAMSWLADVPAVSDLSGKLMAPGRCSSSNCR